MHYLRPLHHSIKRQITPVLLARNGSQLCRDSVQGRLRRLQKHDVLGIWLRRHGHYQRRQVRQSGGMLRERGEVRKYHPVLRGYNNRMEGLQGAILRVKSHHMERWTGPGARIAARYRELRAKSGLACRSRYLMPGTFLPVYGWHFAKRPNPARRSRPRAFGRVCVTQRRYTAARLCLSRACMRKSFRSP